MNRNETDAPKDFLNPNWEENLVVHEWKNYPSSLVKDIWDSFTNIQKAILAANFQEMADREEYN